MLAQPRLEMFATNIFLILGAVLLLCAGAIVVIALWTSAKIAIWHIRLRRAQRDYQERTFREDGGRYPPFIEGACERCGRGDSKVYHPQGQVGMCRVCYEAFWRAEENYDQGDPPSPDEITEPIPVS